MPEDDKFEDDLLFAITRTGDAFDTQQAPLLAGGLQRGRRRWRRRTAVAVAGGATALALVGTGGAYLAGGIAGGPVGGRVAVSAADSGSGSGTPAPAATATPSASPSASPSAAQASQVSADEVLATFKALLPEGTSTKVSATGTEASSDKPVITGSAGASVVFDDGKGKAAIGINITRHAPGDTSQSDLGCPDKKLTRFDACTTSTLPDGSALIVYQGYEYPDGRADTKWWYAELLGKDGRDITLSEWNAPKEKDAPVSRPAPPLDPARLTAVVTDKSWDKVVAALPVPKAPTPRDTGKEYSKEEILAITATLLPAGLTESETDGQPGYADFVVTDAKGKSMVQLNVQDLTRDVKDHQNGTAEHGDIVAQLYGSAQTLPDGTKVVVRKQNGNPAMWTVDTLHPDGLRVVISAFNSGAQNKAATRSTPALTNAQLQAIATSPLWKNKK
ncbi:hypothetical protein [Kitasatospora sp. NPDC057223]|uniref:hypothetical protein n=1 Tax=Kitasatospora sp. NPDC057223 TaxID=3346055 RepID=UPI003633CBB7